MTLDEKLDRVLIELAEIKAIVKPPLEKLCLTRVESMALAGYESNELKAWYKFCSRARLKPYRRKHYRHQDVIEAVARTAFPKRKSKR
jgi:hypothetical protein